MKTDAQPPMRRENELSDRQAQCICDRDYGVGADGILGFCPSSRPTELGAGTPGSSVIVLW